MVSWLLDELEEELDEEALLLDIADEELDSSGNDIGSWVKEEPPIKLGRIALSLSHAHRHNATHKSQIFL